MIDLVKMQQKYRRINNNNNNNNGIIIISSEFIFIPLLLPLREWKEEQRTPPLANHLLSVSHLSHCLNPCLSLSFSLHHYQSSSSTPSDSSHPSCEAASAPLALQRRSDAHAEKLTLSQLGVNTPPLVGSIRCFKLRKRASRFSRVHFNSGAADFSPSTSSASILQRSDCFTLVVLAFSSCFPS